MLNSSDLPALQSNTRHIFVPYAKSLDSAVTATSTGDSKMKQIPSTAEFVPSPSGIPDLAMKQNPVSYTSAERPASARARVAYPIPFLKLKRQAVKQADVNADGGAGPSRRRIRFAETDKKDTDYGSSRSSGLVDYLSSDDEEPIDGDARPSRRSIQFAKTGEEKNRDGSASRSSGLVDYLSSDDEEQADGGAEPSRRRIRFAETDEKDTDYSASRPSGLVDYFSSDDEEQADGEKEEDGSSSVTTMSMKRKKEEAEVKEEVKPKKVLPPLPDSFLKLYPDKSRKQNIQPMSTPMPGASNTSCPGKQGDSRLH
ncbi:hypothetical protein BC936DRAFT_142639 [Jimgerdemannia flammicorona]|uniref:Uncharacterized protein n=1 Tax=Jimgerdemannia flammicorona TaxID=994334 RepID=A0A433A028_9FUNG|nr:hypothetical protein BC936DRAFT_142639 [Jimgerdemannia flammicorona]